MTRTLRIRREGAPPSWRLALLPFGSHLLLRIDVFPIASLDLKVDVVLHLSALILTGPVLYASDGLPRFHGLPFLDDGGAVFSIWRNVPHRIQAAIFATDVNGLVLAAIGIGVLIRGANALNLSLNGTGYLGSRFGPEVHAFMLALATVTPRTEGAVASLVASDCRVGNRRRDFADGGCTALIFILI